MTNYFTVRTNGRRTEVPCTRWRLRRRRCCNPIHGELQSGAINGSGFVWMAGHYDNPSHLAKLIYNWWGWPISNVNGWKHIEIEVLVADCTQWMTLDAYRIHCKTMAQA